MAADVVISSYLKALRLAGLAQGYEQVIRDAEENNLGYRDFLQACLEHEMAWKEQSRVRRLIAQARFPAVKTVDSFDFSAQPDLPSHKILGLMNAGFVGARESVILVGKPALVRPTLQSLSAWRLAKPATESGSTQQQI